MKQVYNLKRWKFALGDTEEFLKSGKNVTVPHTWNIETGTEEVWGNGWYEHRFTVPEQWKNKRVRVKFHAVYHSAQVWLNDHKVGEHKNSGYTPFELELTEFLKFGEENRLLVKANNEFSEEILPYKRSFDWANDGGMIRGAELIVTGAHFAETCEVTARPIIIEKGVRQEKGGAVFGAKIKINEKRGRDETENQVCTVNWKLYSGCDGKESLLQQGSVPVENEKCEISDRILEEINYWHFDDPVLYTLKLQIVGAEEIEDEKKIVFGFRDFHVEGSRFCLNGEYVRLCGTEWMPGSDPAYGNAEPKEQLEKMLQLLKESNCVFTRFHWQQDESVFEWCDRHGMLIQEEVPFWGPEPAVPGEIQWNVFCQQIQEMVQAHRNHPSVIAWGVGNELDGQAEETVQYVKDAVAYTHSLDPERAANYVSNSFYGNPGKDGTTQGDILMINEYMGTWAADRDEMEELGKVCRMNPGKPVVPSEFGLCEPAFSGGDERRNQIFLDKMALYRKFKNIAGTIYFCLNDYRTQMGEDGEGKYRKRIHGSADLMGNPKPSYWSVQRECAPFTVKWSDQQVCISCRKDLPGYEMIGYYVVILDEEKNEVTRIEIPNLCPGQSFSCAVMTGASLKIFRKNGDLAGTY